MTVQFNYNQDQALKGGQPLFITETGAYIVKILNAKYTETQRGARALEFSVETQDGLKGDYISVYYQAANGDLIASGQNMIQAIMGCLNIKQLTMTRSGEHNIAPELTNRTVGLFLQKVLYTKNDNSDGYRFQIICPYGATSGKTLAENIENRPAERIEWLKAHTKDKDDRDKVAQQKQATQEYYANIPSPEYVDDIPW